MITVACVIPTHSRADYLEAALISVSKQSLLPSQIVVVSDVADDEARKICSDMDSKGVIPVVFIESGPTESGASSSRNIGAAAVEADYIAFLDDDDLWQPLYLERAMSDRADEDMIVTWLDEFGDGHDRNGPRMRENLRAQDVASMNPGATGSNIIVSKELFNKIGGFDSALQVKNDTDFLYRALRAGARYRIVDEPLVLQRKHASGQLTARTERRARGTEMYIEKHKSSLTAEDVRIMRQQVERIRMHAGRNRLKRAFHLMRMICYYKLDDFRRVISRGRDKSYAKVASFDDSSL